MSVTPDSDRPPDDGVVDAHADNAPPADVRGRHILLALAGIYTVAIGSLLASGTFAFIHKELLLPFVFIPPLLSGRIRAFANDWLIFLTLIFLFDALRGLVFSVTAFVELPVYLIYAVDLERLLFDGSTAPHVLQELFLREVGWFEELLVIVHASHFLVFLFVGMLIWYWRREHWSSFATGFLVMLYIGLLIYALVPTVPPWMAADRFQVLPPVHKFIGEIYNTRIPGVVLGFNINPIAAMPSLHCALPTFFAIVGWHHFGWKSIPLCLYAGLQFFGVCYSGEHYLVDVIAGIALSAAVYIVIYHSRLSSWRPRLRENSTSRIRLSLLQQRLVLGVLIFAMTHMVARASYNIPNTWTPNESFVDSELVGESPMAEAFRGRYRFSRGDFIGAAQAYGDISEELLVLDDHRKYVTSLLQIAEVDKAVDILNRMVELPTSTPGHIYLRALILMDFGLISRREIEEIIGRFEALEDPKVQILVQGLRERLARLPAAGTAPPR